jgi:hypothetical protein
MPKLDIEKEHEVVKAIEDALNDLALCTEGELDDSWDAAKDILIYLKVRGYEVVKSG